MCGALWDWAGTAQGLTQKVEAGRLPGEAMAPPPAAFELLGCGHCGSSSTGCSLLLFCFLMIWEGGDKGASYLRVPGAREGNRGHPWGLVSQVRAEFQWDTSLLSICLMMEQHKAWS